MLEALPKHCHLSNGIDANFVKLTPVSPSLYVIAAKTETKRFKLNNNEIFAAGVDRIA